VVRLLCQRHEVLAVLAARVLPTIKLGDWLRQVSEQLCVVVRQLGCGLAKWTMKSTGKKAVP